MYFEWPLECIYYVSSFHFDSYRIKRYFMISRRLKSVYGKKKTHKIYIPSQNKFLSKYECSSLAGSKAYVCTFLSELNTFKQVQLCTYSE